METLSGAVLFQDFRNSFPEGPFSCLIATFEDFFFFFLTTLNYLFPSFKYHFQKSFSSPKTREQGCFTLS